MIEFVMLKLGYNSPEVKTVWKLILQGKENLAMEVAKAFSGQYTSENYPTTVVITEMLEKSLSEKEVIEKIAYYLTRHIDTGFEYAKQQKIIELTEEFNTRQDFHLS